MTIDPHELAHKLEQLAAADDRAGFEALVWEHRAVIVDAARRGYPFANVSRVIDQEWANPLFRTDEEIRRRLRAKLAEHA